MFTVDYSLNNYCERYVADLSFSFLHWNLIEQLISGAITVNQIDRNQLKKLIYNILPGGDTVFHRLALSSKGSVISEILTLCHPYTDKATVPACDIHIPFLDNFQNDSPISILH